jgi:two-component system, NtrC family, response regulator AtoC
VRGRILIVDDEVELCRLLEADLTLRGFQVEWDPSADGALRKLQGGRFDAVVADIHLRGANGLELCARLVGERPDVPIVIITAFGSLDTAVGAIRAGAYDYITKPFDTDVLELTLTRAVENRKLREEVRKLRETTRAVQGLDEMLGESPIMRDLFDQIRRVAGSDASVLITGESGSGKEGVARAIHRNSRRASGPFVALNCAAVPEALLESELFGHTKGAFTDARAERTGLFVQADGGTIFLDEIADLALGLQPKLLRALQERRVRRLGADAEVPFDARLIAATNRDLELDVREGRFREDLFFRVQVISLEVPPLRARDNDVLLLSQHFLQSFAVRSGKTIRGLSAPVARKLRDYPWPGNVRELQNCMERAVALSEHEEIVLEDLPERIRNHQPAPVGTSSISETPLVSLQEMEKRHIRNVLEAVSWNKSHAARILGLDRKTLYRRIEGIEAPGAPRADLP